MHEYRTLLRVLVRNPITNTVIHILIQFQLLNPRNVDDAVVKGLILSEPNPHYFWGKLLELTVGQFLRLNPFSTALSQ